VAIRSGLLPVRTRCSAIDALVFASALYESLHLSPSFSSGNSEETDLNIRTVHDLALGYFISSLQKSIRAVPLPLDHAL
jgi:hypothetical protein